MKKYRIKIDSPFGRKGETFTGELICKKEDKSILAKDYPDLFEEIPDRWVPEKDECYYFIEEKEEVIASSWDDHLYHKIRLKKNNVFKTRQKAQAVLDKILKLLEEEKEV